MTATESKHARTPSCNSFMKYLLSENKQKNILKKEGILMGPSYDSDTHSCKKQEIAS